MRGRYDTATLDPRVDLRPADMGVKIFLGTLRGTVLRFRNNPTNKKSARPRVERTLSLIEQISSVTTPSNEPEM